MDALDVRLVRALGTQPFGRVPRPVAEMRPAALARRLRVSPERVKDRLARMGKSGFIAGYEIYPNHRHLGLESSCYYYTLGDEDAVDRAMKELEPLEGVVGLYGFVGGTLCVNLAYRGPAELERRLRVLVALAGMRGDLRKFYDLDMPPVRRPLSNLDWRIIAALRGDAMRPHREVGTALGISAKTVKRRFDRMSAEGSFFVVPNVDPSVAPGCVMFYLALWLAPDADVKVTDRVHRALEPSVLAADTPTDLSICNYGLMCCAWSMREVDALRRKAARVAGVERVQLLMFRAVSERFAWLDEAIAERIKATAR